MEEKSVLEARLAEILTGVNAKYRAMPRAVLKMFGVVAFVGVLVYVYFRSLQLVYAGEKWALVTLIPCAGLLAIGALRLFVFDVIEFFFIPGLSHATVFGWLKRYWQRNVVGNTLWLWRLDGRLEGTVLRRGVAFDRKVHLPPKLSRPIAIIGIPLGGWFRSGNRMIAIHSIYYTADGRANESTRVRLVNMTVDYATIELRGATDGSRMRLSILDALDFLQRTIDAVGIVEWHNIFFREPMWMLQRVLEVEARQLEQAQKRFDDMVVEHKKETIALIDDVVRDLNATKRFIKSKEAEAIRDRLLARQQRYALTRDEERKGYSLATNA